MVLFLLLVSVFGGSGGEEFGYIEFDLGMLDISQVLVVKFDKFVIVLKDCLVLKVDIIGCVDLEFDCDGLCWEVVNCQICEQKFKDVGDVVEVDIMVKLEEENKYFECVYKVVKFFKLCNVIGFVKLLLFDEMCKLMEINV